MIDYSSAIRRPFTNLKKFLIGFLLLVVPIVNIITAVIAEGYFLECAKSAMNKKRNLPQWKDYWGLFVKGLICLVICFLYVLPLIIILGIFLGSVLLNLDIANFINPDPELIASLIAGIGISILIILVVGLFIFYILPAALMGYVIKWKFKDAFNCKKIFRKVLTGEYFVAWFIAGVYGIILVIVIGMIFGFIPLIGPIVGGALVNFIWGVTAFTIFGEIYKAVK